MPSNKFPKNPGSHAALAATMTEDDRAAAEAGVRQLMASGKDKVALDRAKDLYKAQGTPTSEALLIDAYSGRIRSLLDQNLVLEAKSLLELVRERHPSAKLRLDELAVTIAVRSGRLKEVLTLLTDPALTPERRAIVERAIEEEVVDLAAIAGCAELPPEDPLRQAAAALHQAFVNVTSGPVDEEALALPEISRRSPLASWKILVRAIACFHRNDDEGCRQHIGAIRPESACARLVPALLAMLGDKPPGPLNGVATALVSQVTGDVTALRRSLEELDRAFASGNEGHILKAARVAVAECRRGVPGLLNLLQQHITVRCAMADVEPDATNAIRGGSARQDAYFYRLAARGLEAAHEPAQNALACAVWNDFRREAVKEGWFGAKGPEAAALYLHMAGLLRTIPEEDLREYRRPFQPKTKADRDELYFLYPERLYERACVQDPHTEAFAQWMEWAQEAEPAGGERVARAWHKILPGDIEPVLYLMEQAQSTAAFPTALAYLAKAERLDSLHPVVRTARFRLLAGNAMRQIQQKKSAVAVQTVDEMAALPLAQQGDRAAFLAALRYMAATVAGDHGSAAQHRAEVDRVLEHRVAGSFLVATLAGRCKRGTFEKLPPIQKLARAELSTLPVAMARVAALTDDVDLELNIPRQWLVQMAKQFSKNQNLLDTSQLLALGNLALDSDHDEMAYAASAAGLARGGPTEGSFLLLRAQSVPGQDVLRAAVCAAAAVNLAREQRDAELTREALEFLHDELATDGPPLTREQALEVLAEEIAAPVYPKGRRRGPDYSYLAPAEEPCQCPDCRRERGEWDASDFEEDEDLADELENVFNEQMKLLPKDMPPEIARILFEETKKAVERGESLDELMARLTGGGLPVNSKKGRRK